MTFIYFLLSQSEKKYKAYRACCIAMMQPRNEKKTVKTGSFVVDELSRFAHVASLICACNACTSLKPAFVTPRHRVSYAVDILFLLRFDRRVILAKSIEASHFFVIDSVHWFRDRSMPYDIWHHDQFCVVSSRRPHQIHAPDWNGELSMDRLTYTEWHIKSGIKSVCMIRCVDSSSFGND